MTEGFSFLSIASAFEHPQLSVPAKWITKNLINRFDRSAPRRSAFTLGGPIRLEYDTSERCHKDEVFREWVDRFLNRADLGISKELMFRL